MTAPRTSDHQSEQPATRFAKDHLKAFIERIERLEDEKAELASDIRDVYAEAKGTGFDVKALRTIVKLRKQDSSERKEHEAVLDTYMLALGMLDDDDLPPRGGSGSSGAAGSSSRSGSSSAKPSGLQTTAALAQAMADDGMISQEAAAETTRIAAAVDKLGESAIARAVANPKVRAAFKKLGTPVPLTDEEKAKGYSAAFIGKNGTRMAMGAGVPRSKRNDDDDDASTGGPRETNSVHTPERGRAIGAGVDHPVAESPAPQPSTNPADPPILSPLAVLTSTGSEPAHTPPAEVQIAGSAAITDPHVGLHAASPTGGRPPRPAALGGPPGEAAQSSADDWYGIPRFLLRFVPEALPALVPVAQPP